MSLAERLEISVPAWLRDEFDRLPERLDPDEAVAEAIRLARRNVEEGTGGPFGSIAVDDETGEPIAAGVNLVTSSGLSSMHTEVVTLSLTQLARGSWNLASGRPVRIAINAQPCVMCLGAVVWSGVAAVDFALEAAEVERLTGFDEGPIPDDWARQLESRSVRVRGGVRRDDAIRQFEEFRASVERGESVVYNARGGSAE